MPRDLEHRTLDVLESALRRHVTRDATPLWLQRPGRIECGSAWRKIRLIYRRLTDGLELPDEMPPRERRMVDGLVGGRGVPLRIVEFDESQHFNDFRSLTLGLYRDVPVAFPRRTWVAQGRGGRMASGGGWAKPKPPLFPMVGGRHRQRAFRDALADILPAIYGYAPTLRIADFEVQDWIKERGAPARMRRLIAERLDLEEAAEAPA